MSPAEVFDAMLPTVTSLLHLIPALAVLAAVSFAAAMFIRSWFE